jgi:hypothetical protein
MNDEQRIKAIKARIEKGDQSRDKAEQHYASAGILLNELRDGRSRAEWAAIADGRRTVADVRPANAKRVQKYAEKRRSRPLANGQNLTALRFRVETNDRRQKDD